MPARHLALLIARGAGGRITVIVNTGIDGMALQARLALAVAFRILRASRCRRVLRFSDQDWRVLSVPQSSRGLTRSRRFRASFCPAFRGVLACLATGGIDWFEDRFDAIAGDYDTATSGDAAGRTKRVRDLARALSAGATVSCIGEKMLGH